ncbi:MAG TPA: hypothetical protein VKO63_05515 [Chitinispirillaceae bacterium]|nr:hypothetical protein [Chitinispirillaceae bacterium]
MFTLVGDGTRGGKDETDGSELKLLAKIFRRKDRKVPRERKKINKRQTCSMFVYLGISNDKHLYVS